MTGRERARRELHDLRSHEYLARELDRVKSALEQAERVSVAAQAYWNDPTPENHANLDAALAAYEQEQA